jgi:hypothetical protein
MCRDMAVSFLAQREAAERQRAEEVKHAEEAAQHEEAAQQQANEAAAMQCVVPSLKGDSIAGARKALSKGHCQLGRVTAPRGRHGRLVVTRQSVKSGSRRTGGTAVAVTLGVARRGTHR